MNKIFQVILITTSTGLGFYLAYKAITFHIPCYKCRITYCDNKPQEIILTRNTRIQTYMEAVPVVNGIDKTYINVCNLEVLETLDESK